MSVRLKQLDQDGASNGDVATFDTATGLWIPAAIGAGPTFANIQQLAVNTAGMGVGVTYASLFSFIYGGSVEWGGIDSIAILYLINSASGGRNMDVRIFDVDNVLTIAESTGLTDTVLTISDMGAISNIPTGQAIFELQVKRGAGAPSFSVNLPSMSIQGIA